MLGQPRVGAGAGDEFAEILPRFVEPPLALEKMSLPKSRLEMIGIHGQDTLERSQRIFELVRSVIGLGEEQEAASVEWIEAHEVIWKDGAEQPPE